MSHRKTIIFLGDGMADEGLPELGGRTPLQVARKPAMDRIAREGCSGTLLTLPPGFPTSSDVANMSVLGCDLRAEFCGRGPLEAAGRGIVLKPDDVAFRANLVTIEDGILKDFSGGHVEQKAAEELVRKLNYAFGTDAVRFYPGVSYRNILVLSGPAFSARVHAEKPDDHHGDRVDALQPRAEAPEAEATAALIRRMMAEAPALLAACPVNQPAAAAGKPLANGIWIWSGGKASGLRTLKDKYGITGAVISAVDVIVGLGRCLGLEPVAVPGATGYIDTNYEGKADAAIEAIQRHDLVFLHVEGIDEVSHAQDLWAKIKAIEDFDRRTVARVMAAVGPDVNLAVLADHPVPIATGKHTRTPVPVSVRLAGRAPDGVQTHDEVACRAGSLGAMRNGDFMDLLFGRPA